MTSEIRTNTITSRAGLSTVTFTDSGPMFSGITTFVDNSTFSVGTGGTIHAPATNTLNIGVNNTESLRIDSNSNLKVAGIVTATHFYGNGANLTGIPAQATIANNADNRVITGGSGVNLNGEANLTFDGSNVIHAGSDGRRYSFAGGGSSHYMKFDSTLNGIILNGYGGIAFETNGTNERLRIDSSGNINIGAKDYNTHSASIDSLQIGYALNLYEDSYSSGNDNYIVLANNLYYDSGNKYMRNDEASRIMMQGGAFYFQNAAAGTAGNAITLVDVLRITSTGKLLLATTDAGYAASYTNMVIGSNSASDSGITIASSTSGIGRIHFADNNTGNAIFAGWIAYNHSSNKMMFSTNESGSEKVTIDSNGRLSAITAATQINFGNTIGKGGFLLSTTDGQFSISGGGYWGGSNWVATATATTQIRHDGGTGPMKFCFNTGLTAGNNYTPTTRLEITPSGNMKLSDPGITFSDSSPFFPVAWSSVDGVNTTFTIASTTYANLRFRGEYSTGTEFTMGVGGSIFYMAYDCLLYTSPSPRDRQKSRMPSSA